MGEKSETWPLFSTIVASGSPSFWNGATCRKSKNYLAAAINR